MSGMSVTWSKLISCCIYPIHYKLYTVRLRHLVISFNHKMAFVKSSGLSDVLYRPTAQRICLCLDVPQCLSLLNIKYVDVRTILAILSTSITLEQYDKNITIQIKIKSVTN